MSRDVIAHYLPVSSAEMAEEVGYTLAQKTELQSRADYFANLYTLRLDSQKAETKEYEKEKDMKMEDVLKSTRESLNHATFYDTLLS